MVRCLSGELSRWGGGGGSQLGIRPGGELF